MIRSDSFYTDAHGLSQTITDLHLYPLSDLSDRSDLYDKSDLSDKSDGCLQAL